MKNSKLNLALMIVFIVVAVGCLTVLVILADSMMTKGVTGQKIGAVVGLGVAFLLCAAAAGVFSTQLKAKNAQEKLSDDKK